MTSVFSENFHVNVVRNQLTRCLTARFDDVYDELSHSFDVLVPAKEDGKYLYRVDFGGGTTCLQIR